MRRYLATIPLAGLLFLSPHISDADCVDSDLDSPILTYMPGAATALSASSPHPTLLMNIAAQGASLQYFGLDDTTLAPAVPSTSTVVNTPNVVRTSEGGTVYGVFVATATGWIERWDPEGTTGPGAKPDWYADTRRGSTCGDSISATPVVHLRRFADAAFQAQYSTDLIYVATRYGGGCTGGTTKNKVIAYRADNGAVEWEFNGGGTVDVDVILEAPFLDVDNNMLYVGAERTSPSQDSLFAIDLLTGTKAWSVNLGAIWTTPVLRDGTLYVATLGGEIKAVSATDGALIWSVSNGGVPITTNIFVEFREPYDDLIASVDLNGKVWLVRDDTWWASSVWTASDFLDPDDEPDDPDDGMDPPTANATSRVAIDAENGKVYAGADDGQIYQFNIVDGAVEATREVDFGETVGDASFVFQGADVHMIAGSASGVLKKFCGPWETEEYDEPMMEAKASSELVHSVANPGTCVDPVNCGPAPSSCSTWTCNAGVCVAQPLADGLQASCTAEGVLDPFRTGHECNGGVCEGYTDCQLAVGSCKCTELSTLSITRKLLTTEPVCAAPPTTGGLDLPATWCDGGVTTAVRQTSCIEPGSGAASVAWVHLLDENRRPFKIGQSITMGLEAGITMNFVGGTAASGDPPLFYDANSGNTSSGPATLANGLVHEGSRPGTYFANVVPDPTGELADTGSAPGWRLAVGVAHSAAGLQCIVPPDQGGPPTVASLPMKTLAVGLSGCPFDSNQDAAGYLKVTVQEESGGTIEDAIVQVGYAAVDNSYAADYEEVISNSPSLPNYGTTDSNGVIEFNDVGNYLNGPGYVFATCPDGEIHDARTWPQEQNTKITFTPVNGTAPDIVVTPPAIGPQTSSDVVITLKCL